MKFDRRLFTSFDWTLFSVVLGLVIIGIVNIYSAGFSMHEIKQNPQYIKQIQWVIVGLAAMVVAFCIDYRIIARYAYVIYGISLLLLIAVFLYGTTTNGSQRWIILWGFSFQPSELMKLTVIIALAKFFDDYNLTGGYELRDLCVPFLIMLAPFLLIIKQPDLGTALILAIIFVSMVIFVGIRFKSFLIACCTGLLLAPLSWFFLKEYQKERILTVFNPERDPLGTGYHIIQSIIAVGSGGIFGKGYLKGTQTQLQFLPEQHTDFVFSVFAEEWGFLGGFLLVFMFLMLILWGFKIALHSRDLLGTLIAYGITMLIFWKVFINIGMVLGILPVVGIPLPFLSYGGSAIVVLMMGIGILMNVSMRRFILQS
ncbi:MAG: rod shape-determining protein RodA [Deltaproteobacteria bacterium]|nr:rod shape-determining protein RodA [Deltaproteobacteria bacterium]